jgi:3',5'-nucleoside bisphosphate phosphatase
MTKTNLHVHSRYSDGSLWPDQLVQRARMVGLTDIALTDHDTMRGVAEFLDCCDAAHGRADKTREQSL